jgi:hypothetical protein
MRIIDNVWHLIKPEWLEYFKTNPGFQFPKDLNLPKNIVADVLLGDTGWELNQDELEWYTTKSYDPYGVNMEGFDNHNCPFDIAKTINFGRPNNAGWWIVRQHPGQYMPWHRDLTCANDGCYTYWIPLDDWESGHVFVYADKTISHYKKGDVFQFDNTYEWHTGCNIGYSTRTVLQIRTYD